MHDDVARAHGLSADELRVTRPTSTKTALEAVLLRTVAQPRNDYAVPAQRLTEGAGSMKRRFKAD